jgi:hypothetical protein
MFLSGRWRWTFILSLLVAMLSQVRALDVSKLFVYLPDTSEEHKEEMQQALRDAMTLARFVAIAAVPCEEVCTAYKAGCSNC